MGIPLVEIGHGRDEPSVDRMVKVIVGDVRIVDGGKTEVCEDIPFRMVVPVLGRHIGHPGMGGSGMVEDHVHYHLHVAVVRFAYKSAPVVVGAEARIDAVIVGCGITVIGAVRHIVLEDRTEPDGGHSERVEVSQMALHTEHIATVTRIGIATVVRRLVAETLLTLRVARFRQPPGEAVGHEQIQHIFRRKTLVIFRTAVARLQLVG